MAAAEAWAIAEREGKVQVGSAKTSKPDVLIKDPRKHFSALFGVGYHYVEQARALLKEDPPGAEAVRLKPNLAREPTILPPQPSVLAFLCEPRLNPFQRRRRFEPIA